MPNQTSYIEQLKILEKLVLMAIAVSDKSGGIKTTTLGIESTKIYTRLTLSAMTINAILPNNSINNSKLLDFPSVAVLARTFMETTHRYLYLCIPGESKEEQQFRQKLHYFHMNFEKYRLYSDSGTHLDWLPEFEEKLPLEKAALMESSTYKELDKHMQNRVRSGNTEMHFTDEQIADKHRLAFGRFKPIYRILSNHSHGSPFATTSQSNERGRGLENKVENDYLELILLLVNRYLSKIIIAQAKLLKLQKKCHRAVSYATEIFSTE
ncbi:DUF5677 domain-containing protein [Pseudomonas thivervalensis]|uniref:DUF5677 domain-containing protein n=1 Tax=Pseudomonas thivervalensis TaxID=86265 RepID=UPI001ABFA250|nr:DUF5677 domain-containing protein [Pseudomonas thivervalensis]